MRLIVVVRCCIHHAVGTTKHKTHTSIKLIPAFEAYMREVCGKCIVYVLVLIRVVTNGWVLFFYAVLRRVVGVFAGALAGVFFAGVVVFAGALAGAFLAGAFFV